MDTILNSQRGSPERFTALIRFVEQRIDSTVFPEVSEAQKRKLVEELCQIVKESTSQSIVPTNELSNTLKVLRILSREERGMEALHNNQAIEWTMKLCHLLPCEKTYDDEVLVEEAMKCLVNIVVKGTALIDEFARLGGHLACFDRLKGYLTKFQEMNNISSETTSAQIGDQKIIDGYGKHENIMLPLCRLLFAVSRPNDHNQEILKTMNEKLFLDLISEFIFIWSHALKTDPSVATRTSLHDLLKCVINLTVDMGALGSNDVVTMSKFIPRFPRMLQSMLRFLKVPAKQFKDHIYELHMLVAACLVNIPKEAAMTALADENGQFGTQEEIEQRTAGLVKTLCDVLYVGIELDKPSNLVPMMMWMGNLAKAVPRTHSHFLSIMFPTRNLDEEGPGSNAGIAPPKYEEKNLGNGIIRLMTSVEIAVKHWSNELLYIICGEDTDLFVRLTGFGNAAGLLVNRNLFGMGSLANAKTTREDVANMTRSPSSTPDSNSKQPHSNGVKTEEIDSDEEEEKARRIMTKLEDMERRGLVKLVRKGDNQPDMTGGAGQSKEDKDEDGSKGVPVSK